MPNNATLHSCSSHIKRTNGLLFAGGAPGGNGTDCAVLTRRHARCHTTAACLLAASRTRHGTAGMTRVACSCRPSAANMIWHLNALHWLVENPQVQSKSDTRCAWLIRKCIVRLSACRLQTMGAARLPSSAAEQRAPCAACRWQSRLRPAPGRRTSRHVAIHHGLCGFVVLEELTSD